MSSSADSINSLLDSVRSYAKKSETLHKTARITRGMWHLYRKNRIFRNIRHGAAGNVGGKKVLIYGLRTIPTVDLTYVDALFGHAFKKLGCRVKMVYCDALLDSCDADSVNKNQRVFCFACRSCRALVKKVLRLEHISFKEHINAAEISVIKDVVAKLDDSRLIDYEYLGVDVGKYAKSSTIRYFLVASIDPSDKAHAAILRKKLVDAMIVTLAASKIHSSERPDLVFMLHGIYSSWGPFYKYFRTKDVDVIVYNYRDERFGHAIFNKNGCLFNLFAPKAWEAFRQEPLNDHDKKQIESFLNKRFNGLLHDSMELYEKTYNKSIDKRSRLASLSSDRYKRRYVLFSNLFWDAVVEDMGSSLFRDIVVWIDKTVEHFMERPDLQLIIKPHPGEMGGASGERSMFGVGEYISKRFPGLTDNIHILEADTPIRAYDLVTPNTIGLTYNGTVGLELATQGVPALIVGNCHYKEAGVVYKIRSVQDYFDVIDHPERIISFAKDSADLAKKYAFYYFFKTMVRLPLFSDVLWDTMDWKAISDFDSLFGNDNYFMKIAASIIEGKEVLGPL